MSLFAKIRASKKNSAFIWDALLLKIKESKTMGNQRKQNDGIWIFNSADCETIPTLPLHLIVWSSEVPRVKKSTLYESYASKLSVYPSFRLSVRLQPSSAACGIAKKASSWG